MITKFEFTNSTNEVLTLDLMKPWDHGIAVTKVTGLGPVNATINATEISTLDGGFFNSARLPTRNIVFSLLYLWEGPGSIEEKRHFIYKYFSVKKNVRIKIFTDTRTLVTDGYVEKNEIEIFSKEEGSEISIICPDPYFYAASGNHVTDFYTSNPLATFTEVAEAVIGRGFHSPHQGTMVLGKAVVSGDMQIQNDGDTECGCVVKLYAVGSVSGLFTLYNITRDETFKLDLSKVEGITGYPVSTGDQIEITSIRGHKAVLLIRNGQQYNLLPCLDRQSDWIQLNPGNNEVGYIVEHGENLHMSVENPIMYEGV